MTATVVSVCIRLFIRSRWDFSGSLVSRTVYASSTQLRLWLVCGDIISHCACISAFERSGQWAGGLRLKEHEPIGLTPACMLHM